MVAPVNVREFLETWATVDELKGILYTYGQPRSGTKDVLISRIAEAEASSVETLTLLNNVTIQDVLRKHGLSAAGRKAELVIRLIQNGVVHLGEDQILSFLDSRSKDDFDAYHELLLCIPRLTRFDHLSRLLGKATEGHLRVFLKLLRSGSDFPRSADALVPLLLSRSNDVPSMAAFLLEGLAEAEGTILPVASATSKASDELMARQRSIRKSFARHPQLSHPAVDSLLQRVWSGEFGRAISLLEGVRKEVRSGSQKIESVVAGLRDSSGAAALDDVRKRATRIESATEDIQRGVQTVQDQLRDLEQEVSLSPERVASALERLLQTKEMKWGAKRKIRRDLRVFWTLADRAQKIEFLGRAILTYGPMVVSALRGQL